MIKIMDKVLLSEEEAKRADEIGRLRAGNATHNKMRMVFGERGGPDILGMRAEYAFYKLVDPGKEPAYYVGLITDTPDIIYKKLRIDIKATNWNPPFLKVPLSKIKFKVDYYVVMLVQNRFITYYGAMKHDDIIQEQRIFRGWNYPCYVARTQELYDLP